MLYTIHNEYLTVSADTLGAELRSIRSAGSGIDYLWQGKSDFWRSSAPLLFPVIGRLKKGVYTLDGTPYAMKLHGFAKDAEFHATIESDTVMSFTLRDSPATLASWPFAFELEIRYTLSKSAIKKEHIVRNRSASEMLYEIGGHEGFNVALFPGEKMEDYYIQFDGMDSIRSFVVDADLMITKETKTLALDEGRLELAMRLFDGDALILDRVADRRVTIGNTKNKERVRVDFADFDYLGIWTRPGKAETNFVCIEPWSSLPDCSYLDSELRNKHGIRHLGAGAVETLTYTMRFGDFQADSPAS
jgi:galactose mutarotase-like enzyme